jgi:hypothetical protein
MSQDETINLDTGDYFLFGADVSDISPVPCIDGSSGTAHVTNRYTFTGKVPVKSGCPVVNPAVMDDEATKFDMYVHEHFGQVPPESLVSPK